MSKLQIENEETGIVGRFWRGSSRWASVFAAAMVFFLAWEVFRFGAPVAGGSDSSGYLNFARSLGDGKMLIEQRVPDGLDLWEGGERLFYPLGYRNPGDGSLVPTYPIGMPLMMAPLLKLFGLEMGIRLLLAAVVGLAGWGFWKLGRNWGVSGISVFFGMAAMFVSPLFFLAALSPMTDALSLCLAVWTIFFSIRSPASLWWAVLAGIALGMAVLVRPTGVFLGFAVVAALVVENVFWKRFAWVVVGGLPSLAILLYSNKAMYGDWLASGYGSIGHLLRVDYVWLSLANIWENGRYALSPIVMALVITSIIGSVFLGRRSWILAFWSLPTTIFYLVYWHTHEAWWFLRFLLPALPGFVLWGLWGFERMAERIGDRISGGFKLAAYAVALVLVIGHGISLRKEKAVYLTGAYEGRYAAIGNWLSRNAEENALVMAMQCSGSVYYYTDLAVFRYDKAKEKDWLGLRKSLEGSGVSVYAALFDFEVKSERSPLKVMAGDWNEVKGEFGSASVFRLDY
ncbi:MAG: hypothetical protein AAGB46_08290 [Verrucomicrobiota bacterium]